MNLLNFTVNGNRLVFTENAYPTSGGYSYDKCSFTFDSEWTGFSKKAVFSSGNSEELSELIESNICTVPEEMLRKAGLLKIGVVGINGAGTIISTNVVTVRIDTGANETGSYPVAAAIEIRESGGGVG